MKISILILLPLLYFKKFFRFTNKLKCTFARLWWRNPEQKPYSIYPSLPQPKLHPNDPLAKWYFLTLPCTPVSVIPLSVQYPLSIWVNQANTFKHLMVLSDIYLHLCLNDHSTWIYFNFLRLVFTIYFVMFPLFLYKQRFDAMGEL